MNRPSARGRMLILLFGAAMYAALFALLSQIDESGTCSLGKAFVRFLPALPVALAALWLLLCALPRAMNKRLKPIARDEGEKRFGMPVAFALILLSFVPMFLVFYPGSFMYDTQRQTFQIAGNAYDMFHPLLHTLMIRFALSFLDRMGSFERCAALYSLMQMTLLAACFALTCASLSRIRSRREARWAVLFFMLYPAHMAMASNCIKDVLFSGFFALFVTLCVEEACRGLSRGHCALAIVSGILACLLRNNMIYAAIVWVVILLIFGRRMKRLLVMALTVIVLAQGANAALGAWTDAAHGSVAEMLSVPIQQLARAYRERPECFTEEDIACMDALFPEQAYLLYEPTLSDPVKNAMDTGWFSAHRMEALALWARIGRQCPGVYVDAFLNLTLPSLYPYSQYRVAQPYIEVGLQNHVLTGPFAQPDMTSPARFEGIRRWLDEHIFKTGADDIPVVRLLFNTGAIFWLCGLCVLAAVIRGDGRRLLVLALPVLLYMTYLLGPVMQGRYLYPFVCILPTLLAPGRTEQLSAAKAQ